MRVKIEVKGENTHTPKTTNQSKFQRGKKGRHKAAKTTHTASPSSARQGEHSLVEKIFGITIRIRNNFEGKHRYFTERQGTSLVLELKRPVYSRLLLHKTANSSSTKRISK